MLHVLLLLLWQCNMNVQEFDTQHNYAKQYEHIIIIVCKNAKQKHIYAILSIFKKFHLNSWFFVWIFIEIFSQHTANIKLRISFAADIVADIQPLIAFTIHFSPKLSWRTLPPCRIGAVRWISNQIQIGAPQRGY